MRKLDKRQIYLGLGGGFLFSSLLIVTLLFWSYYAANGYCDFIGLTPQNPCSLPQFIFHNFFRAGTIDFFIAFIIAALISEYAQKASFARRIAVIVLAFVALFYIAEIVGYLQLYASYNMQTDVGNFLKVNFREQWWGSLMVAGCYVFWRLVVLRHWDKNYKLKK